MSNYVPIDFINEETLLDEVKMDHLQDGIVLVEGKAEAADAKAAAADAKAVTADIKAQNAATAAQAADDKATLALSQAAPPGVVTAYAGSVAPQGWLFCDGAAISRTTYANLFAAIGTAYGAGDGSSTFNLPDFRGRMLVGRGQHADVDTLGDNEGAALAARRPGHAHTGVTDTPNRSYPTTQPGDSSGQHPGTDHSHSFGTDTRAPAYLVVNHIIKT